MEEKYCTYFIDQPCQATIGCIGIEIRIITEQKAKADITLNNLPAFVPDFTIFLWNKDLLQVKYS